MIFHLIRHGRNDLLDADRIAGRQPGVPLNGAGRAQAERVAHRLADLPIDAIFSSPLERAFETASPLARLRTLEVVTSEDLQEIDMGEWTGKSIDEIRDDPLWERFNSYRTGTRPPGGELMSEVQSRMVRAMVAIRDAYPEGRVAIVSHGDSIKSLVAHWLGIPLDFFLRFEISPASETVVEVNDWGPRVLCLNRVP